MSKEHSRDEGLAWKVFLQGLNVASGEVVNEARKEYIKPLVDEEKKNSKPTVESLHLNTILSRYPREFEIH